MYKKRSLESSEMPVPYRGSAVPKGYYGPVQCITRHGKYLRSSKGHCSCNS